MHRRVFIQTYRITLFVKCSASQEADEECTAPAPLLGMWDRNV